MMPVPIGQTRRAEKDMDEVPYLSGVRRLVISPIQRGHRTRRVVHGSASEPPARNFATQPGMLATRGEQTVGDGGRAI